MEAIEIRLSDTLEKMPETARVWIYQSSRPFSEMELTVLRSQLRAFVGDWTAHSNQLSAAGDVLFERFLVLAVDESQAGASGCSIDKSVNFLKGIENQYNTQLFERMHFAFLHGEDVEVVPSGEFSRLYTVHKDSFGEGGISENTLVFDNLVQSIGDMKKQWIKPLNKSWHKRFV
jgi:hypothetical protein